MTLATTGVPQWVKKNRERYGDTLAARTSLLSAQKEAGQALFHLNQALDRAAREAAANTLDEFAAGHLVSAHACLMRIAGVPEIAAAKKAFAAAAAAERSGT